MDEIRYVQGVPRWFTYLHHMIERRTCRKVGHADFTPIDSVCARCGQILRKP
jgi:hypothetical protein